MHLVIAWSLLSATVGLILSILDRAAQRKGVIPFRVVNSMLGLLWGIISFFVVPVMVYPDLGPTNAIKKLIESLKKTWGESLIRYYGLGMMEMVSIVIDVIIALFFYS